ncbi:MAG TPA: nuclear transport factor 2 family protein [Candidatus Limnocylindrales bacterium]|nr:nuclear transport factor 2 family protein [Candidatus Limnocylindrales bacterium]
MTRDDVARWLDAYVDAWKTYDAEAIGALFSADCEYRYHPWDEPLRGREAIVADWLEEQDSPGTYEASYAPWAVEGTRAVAVGTSRYDDGQERRLYHNVFLLEFDESGACRAFTETFILQR